MLLLSLGLVAAGLIRTGGYGWFVQQRMLWPLVFAAVVLVLLGTYEAVQGVRQELKVPDSKRWGVAPVVGWLLLLPLVVLIGVSPAGLGAAAAGRVEAFTPTDQTDTFGPLNASNGPVEMRVYDFLDRALWDTDESLDGVPVRLEGLVVNDERVPDGFMLTRFMVSCCAADGIPLQVAVRGVEAPLPNDTWVVVDLMWQAPEVPYAEAGGATIVEADVIGVTPVPEAPNDPYESPF